MEIKSFIKKWYNKEIEDYGGYTSPEYEEFQKEYRNALRTLCKQNNWTLHSFHKNHYEFCCVLKSNITNQFEYFSISDVRFWKNEWADCILYRTMEHEKDWTGGANQYCKLADFGNVLARLNAN